MAIVNEMCMEFGKNTSFYFVCKFIYHTTFFRNKLKLLCVTNQAFFGGLGEGQFSYFNISEGYGVTFFVF